MDLVQSKNWDCCIPLDDLFGITKFAFFYKQGNQLAPGSYQYLKFVHGEHSTGGLLFFELLVNDNGVEYHCDGVTGHGFVYDASQEYEMTIFTDPRKCLEEYAKLLGYEV